MKKITIEISGVAGSGKTLLQNKIAALLSGAGLNVRLFEKEFSGTKEFTPIDGLHWPKHIEARPVDVVVNMDWGHPSLGEKGKFLDD